MYLIKCALLFFFTPFQIKVNGNLWLYNSELAHHKSIYIARNSETISELVTFYLNKVYRTLVSNLKPDDVFLIEKKYPHSMIIIKRLNEDMQIIKT